MSITIKIMYYNLPNKKAENSISVQIPLNKDKRNSPH